ncbi:MAG TPA: CapA family protein [Patescibacteria group bacterium]|nr:CapA family protein [Patescibacteria group bacterium]
MKRLIFFLILLFFLLFYSTKSTKVAKKETPDKIIDFITRNHPQNTSAKKLRLDDIFMYWDPEDEIETGQNSNEITLLVTGDVLLARAVNAQMIKKGDFRGPFRHTATFLQNADLTFINLETPLPKLCPATTSGMTFCGSQKGIEGLLFSGIDVVNLANNHIGNYGQTGITETIEVLEGNKFYITGQEKPAIVEIKNKKIGFLGYNDIGETISNTYLQDIQNVQKVVDFVVVMFHWGSEYTYQTHSRQIERAHAAVDAGADLIVGNHPHWVQGVEIYKNTVIAYSHGNFIFDQMWSQETREGVIGKYIFDDQGAREIRFYPIIIEDYWQPRFAHKQEAERILKNMKKFSIF